MTTFMSAWRALDDARHRAELYRMWRAGAAAGFTVPHALETIGVRPGVDVEQVRGLLLRGTRRGATVADLVRMPASPFSPFEAGLLALGDESGRLEESLRLLADFFARKHRTMLAVRKRMTYPLFVGLCATFIAPVPLLFRGHTRAYLVTAAMGIVLWTFAGGAVVLAASERFGRAPALVRARLARALASAIEAGLPLDRALSLAADAAGDPAVRSFVYARAAEATDDRPLTARLAGCPHLTAEFIAVLSNAERTGDYTGTLARLADLYEDGFT